VKNTGFELVIPRTVPTTTPPTDEELDFSGLVWIRDGVLKNFRLTVG